MRLCSQVVVIQCKLKECQVCFIHDFRMSLGVYIHGWMLFFPYTDCFGNPCSNDVEERILLSDTIR